MPLKKKPLLARQNTSSINHTAIVRDGTITNVLINQYCPFKCPLWLIGEA